MHCNISILWWPSSSWPLQHTATYCDTLRHTATHCDTLQHTATHCNTLQHMRQKATHYNTLQHTATHCSMTPIQSRLAGRFMTRVFDMTQILNGAVQFVFGGNYSVTGRFMTLSIAALTVRLFGLVSSYVWYDALFVIYVLFIFNVLLICDLMCYRFMACTFICVTGLIAFILFVIYSWFHVWSYFGLCVDMCNMTRCFYFVCHLNMILFIIVFWLLRLYVRHDSLFFIHWLFIHHLSVTCEFMRVTWIIICISTVIYSSFMPWQSSLYMWHDSVFVFHLLLIHDFIYSLMLQCVAVYVVCFDAWQL